MSCYQAWNISITVVVKEGSKGDKLINSKLEAEIETVENLKNKKSEYTAKIWASQKLDEALKFLDELKNL